MIDEPWEDEGGRYLFHYTEASIAARIAEDEHFLVGGGAEFGYGLYATDIRPEEADPEEIREVCFGGDAAGSVFDGVLVLLGDDAELAFEEVEPRAFCCRAEEGIGQVIPLHSILVGLGVRNADGAWEVAAWP